MILRLTVTAVAASLLTSQMVMAASLGAVSTVESLQPAPAVCDPDAKPANLAFTLQDMDGNTVNLAAFRGKVIVLNFWATWCVPCRIEIPGLVELQETYGDQGLVVLGLSVNDPAELIKPFAEEFGVNYPLLVGLDRIDVQQAFAPIYGIPITFLIARDGTWCRTHRGLTTKLETERDILGLL
jgi:thiol-disulfide isomerase/thioredoxin